MPEPFIAVAMSGGVGNSVEHVEALTAEAISGAVASSKAPVRAAPGVELTVVASAAHLRRLSPVYA